MRRKPAWGLFFLSAFVAPHIKIESGKRAQFSNTCYDYSANVNARREPGAGRRVKRERVGRCPERRRKNSFDNDTCDSFLMASERPLIVGLGGTVRPGSSSEKLLRVALAAAQAAGVDTEILAGDDLSLPPYAPPGPGAHVARDAKAHKLVETLRRCDGLILASPSYHGSISGLVKNAIDYVEDLRDDARPYLDGRAVGCIVCAAGWQSIGPTLGTLRSIIHALRGWPTPYGAGINTAQDGAKTVEAERQLQIVGRQVAEFALMQRAAKAAGVEASRAAPGLKSA
jgi:FMN reductase